MQFEKWQALGNDYLIVEQDELPWRLTPGRVRALCAGHTGVFADGVLLLARSERPDCAADLRIFNPDGSESGLSGNGSRQAALYLRRHGWASADTFAINTPSGVVHPTVTSPTTVTMALGRAATASPDYPSGRPDGRGSLSADRTTWSFRHVQVGNPQCAIRVESEDALAALDLAAIGAVIERHELFPNRTNVSWYVPLAEDLVRARIFERGVGETESSGTGATGAAVAHVLDGGRSPVTVVLDGGELTVGVGEALELTLSGWALPVFAGTLSDELVKELHEIE
ncbi:MAG: diaminopimelate epimerase [Solirubrobacteraceae bacterium]